MQPVEKDVCQLVNCLIPQDIKGLSKRQIADLKDGKKPPEQPIRKYARETSGNTPPKNEQHMPPSKPSKVPQIGLNTRRRVNPPTNQSLAAQSELKPQSTLNGESSQSLSLSKVIDIANSKSGLSVSTLGNRKQVSSPIEHTISGLELQNSEFKLLKKKEPDSGVSMDWSTKGDICNQNKKMISKPEFGLKQGDWADIEDKSIDFT